MERRNFLRTLGLAASGLALPRLTTAAPQKSMRPNIIFFLTDDQDKHSIGAYGGKSLTPNLDRLAREGTVFHQAFVSSTVCTPSRYSFLTGRYAGRSHSAMYRAACPPGMQGYPSFNMELEDDNLNVGAVLQKSGYVTGYVGKYHVGPDIKRPDDFAKYGLRAVADDASPKEASAAFRHNERWYREHLKGKGFSWAKNIYWGNLQKPFNHHNGDWTIAAALEFIEENRARPFYLHYCTTLVHGPDKSWSASLEHPEVSGAGLLEEPAGVTDRRALVKELRARGLDPEQGHAGYRWVDENVGALLKKLDALGLADNTLFVFTSDHGSRMKGSLFHADGVNVPCILRWPKGVKAGAECHELIQNIDFAPTFFDLAGATPPKKYVVDGRSLRPLLGGAKPGQWRDRLYFEIGAARAVCTKEWKYIAVRYTKEQLAEIKRSSPEQLPKRLAYIGRTGIGVRGASNPNFFDADQLYNLRQDPDEKKNLAGDPQYQRQLEKMRELLRQDLQALGRPFGEFAPGGDAAPPGQIDEQLALVKKIKIQGKKIVLPDGRTVDEKEQNAGQQRQAERDKRREARKKKSQ